MAEAEDDRWGEVNEENMMINSGDLIIQDDHFDHPSSSATSYTASVTNSPLPETNAGSITDEGENSRRLSIDQLTEEAEADLANNNDPNNNSSANEGDYNPVLNEPLNAVSGQPLSSSAVEAAATPLQEVEGESSQSSFIENLYFGSNQSNANAADDEEIDDPYQRALESDIELILKLMPDKAYDEVRCLLESHQGDPKRVQIVLNEFLEEPATMKRREISPEPVTRNKAGNGLKAKNSKAKGKSSRTAASATANPDEPSASSSTAPEVWGNLDSELESEIPTSTKRKRKQLLDLNLDDHILAPSDQDEDSSSSSRSAQGSKRARLDVMSVSILDTDQVTSTSSKKADPRHKIQLSEDQLHGPFNFSAHRPQKHKSKTSAASSSSGSGSVKFDALREDLKSLVTSSKQDKSSSSKMTSAERSPALVDISDGGGSPVLVDLSQSDTAEIRDLFSNFKMMFPNTPVEYLEEMAEELAGKPIATERFISELLARDSKPPDFWNPIDKTIANIKDEQPMIMGQPNTAVNLNKEDQGLNMTMDAITDQSLDLQDDFGEPRPGPSDAIADDVVLDLQDAFRPRPEGSSGGPTPLNSEHPSAPESPKPGPSTKVNDTIDLTDNGPKETKDGGPEDNEEDMANKKLEHLIDLFPNADPEFLHQKVVELAKDRERWEGWISETIENKSDKDFPSRKDYEQRQKEAEMMEKYSGQVTVQEILDMYEDPEAYFMDDTRKVSDLYKKHALAQLKKEFRTVHVQVINKIFNGNNFLFLPSVRVLNKYRGNMRKTRRPDHECAMPQEIDINFLKELQYSRKEEEVKKYIQEKESEYRRKVENAKEDGSLLECTCCYSDECLEEDMLPCDGGHLFCRECVQRASEVAIGEGKHQLNCLGQCDEVFSLSILQKALKAATFSKWLSRIQLAELEKAEIDGLEQCPFCNFANIMDTTPEENKVFVCQNPDCGKESCRLCKEISHIPLRCEEVEKDAETRKRTYIENKMTEALIRKCYKCSKPFVKLDGCNKMTCPDCGAQMCYLCRQPVRDYKHFFGQGGVPQPGQMCPLFSDNNTVHERDVARGALEAKSEMDKENPDVKLKHDPAANINLEAANSDPNRVPAGQPFGLAHAAHVAAHAAAHVRAIPPGMEGVMPDDPMERQRMIREQERIEAMIQGRPPPPPIMHNYHQFMHNQHQHPYHQHFNEHLNHRINDVNGFVNRMGELLQLREVQRQRNRVIRRREQQALEEFQIHRIAQPVRRENADPPPEAAPAPAVQVGPVHGGPPVPAGPPVAGPQDVLAMQRQAVERHRAEAARHRDHANRVRERLLEVRNNQQRREEQLRANRQADFYARGAARHRERNAEPALEAHFNRIYQENNRQHVAPAPVPAHRVQPAPPIPPPPQAHAGRDQIPPPHAHQIVQVQHQVAPQVPGRDMDVMRLRQRQQDQQRVHWRPQQVFGGIQPPLPAPVPAIGVRTRNNALRTAPPAVNAADIIAPARLNNDIIAPARLNVPPPPVPFANGVRMNPNQGMIQPPPRPQQPPRPRQDPLQDRLGELMFEPMNPDNIVPPDPFVELDF